VKENIDIFTTGDRLRFHQDNFICIQKTWQDDKLVLGHTRDEL
jgi:hypothetical protein